MTASTPALHQLVGGYLHQDMYDFYADVDAAVDAFMAESSLATALPAEIDHVLASLDETGLEAFLVDDLGIGFVPEHVAGGYRGWLARVSREAARRRP